MPDQYKREEMAISRESGYTISNSIKKNITKIDIHRRKYAYERNKI